MKETQSPTPGALLNQPMLELNPPLLMLTMCYQCGKVFASNVDFELHKEVNIGNMGICVQADKHIENPLDRNNTDTTHSMDIIITPDSI